MIDKVYCFSCGKKVEYKVENRKLHLKHLDICVEFDGQEATCNVCNGVVSVKSITRVNIIKAIEVFKDKYPL